VTTGARLDIARAILDALEADLTSASLTRLAWCELGDQQFCGVGIEQLMVAIAHLHQL
jgi:hypothetical protein